MNQTLRVSKFRDKKKEGGRITVTDEREIRDNDDRKVYVLDNHVFRSMANLIYFFEFLNHNSDLIEKFYGDIEDLLGLHFGSTRGRNRKYSSRKYRSFMRLIKSILGYHGPKHDQDNKFYFQRQCMRIIQRAVGDKVAAFASRDNRYDAKQRSDINTQMFHAAMCVDSYANILTGRENNKPNRIIE